MSTTEKSPESTRGAQKLEAALRELDLHEQVRGKRAIDIGASTGGFTATLLAHGATHVTAIDVGHDQILASLRADARVAVLEKTDFRRVSLDVAPGPFELFSVDVSFVAARNMLRSLAFRLQPGAQGIVLLKPQFELGKGELRSGSVADPALRKRAVERFTERAERCGFRILQVRDSSVTGESGTVEMIVHLAFDGRPEGFPTRDGDEAGVEPRAKPSNKLETKPAARGKRAAREPGTGDALKTEYEWFAIAAPGLEPLLAAELSAIGSLREVTQLAGGVGWKGTLLAGYAANLSSRLATRVLVRLGKVRAREFAMLRRRLHVLPFERFIEPNAALRILVTVHHCRLYHTKALAETVTLAISDRLRAPVRRLDTVEEADELAQSEEAVDGASNLAFGLESYGRVLLRGQDDEMVISIDSSGLLLHRRGGRPEAGAAPMRETLAAALLLAAGYTGEELLVDAMCGAGTLALEAAQLSTGKLPGVQRAFAIERFAGLPADALQAEKQRLVLAAARAPRAPIVGFDRDRKMIDLARRNAERTGVAEHITFQNIDLRDAQPPGPTGLLVANPPYGRRLGRKDDLSVRYRSIGHALRARWQGFRVALLVPRGTPEAWLGLKVEKRVPLVNGGVKVVLVIGTPER